MKRLVFGGQGQLGTALRRLMPDAVFLDRREADMSRPESLTHVLEKHAPDVVINAAAYTQVDNAEAEEELAQLVNAESPAVMAIYCAANNVPLIHFSTDYVFDGSGDAPWHEHDPVNPLNAYGRTKLAGEDKIQQVGGKYLIFRTSWLYDATGKNFLNTMLRLGAEREELRIVSDQYGAPTYVPQMAAASLNALNHALALDEFPSGVYHLCHSGAATWHGFALAIFEQARRMGITLKVRSVLPVASADYPTAAKRPHNSRLDCSKAYIALGVDMPSWQQGLAACMEEKYARQ